MRLSVVIPAQDEAENIGACLESLQAQRRRSDEVIVVDNGSEDKTAEIARSFGVQVLFHPRAYRRGAELGLVKQRGLEQSTGDILVTTDADCIFPEDWLEKIERSFAGDSRLVLLGGPALPSNRDPLNDVLLGCSNFHRGYWSRWGIPNFWGCNTSFRREAFMLTEGFKGAGAAGPVDEIVVTLRMSRMGDYLWSDDVYVYTKVPESWRAPWILLPVSTSPLVAWAGITLLQGML